MTLTEENKVLLDLLVSEVNRYDAEIAKAEADLAVLRAQGSACRRVAERFSLEVDPPSRIEIALSLPPKQQRLTVGYLLVNVKFSRRSA